MDVAQGWANRLNIRPPAPALLENSASGLLFSSLPGGPACFSGALSVFWEGHSGERQLQFLARVHGLERLVLIAHAGCAFYLDWLKTRPEELEARQIDDLLEAAARLRAAHPALAVEMYLARRSEGKIRFDRSPQAFNDWR